MSSSEPITARSGLGALAEAVRIPLAQPVLEGNELRYLAECVETNFVSSVGPFVERFERAFADVVGTRHAVAVSSGTAAIHLAIRVLDIPAGGEVLVPSLTFIASANPVRYERAEVVLVDSEETSLGIDPVLVVDELERRARSGLRQPAAIEVVHLLGHPADIAPVILAADRHGVPVIEDASEALGATWTAGPFAGRQVGSVGRLGCFSFNGNKIITTGGGGMIVTDDADLALRARHLSTQARLPGRAYDHDEVGYNYRLSNIAAAIGLAQLERLPDLLARRRAVAARYDAALEGLGRIRPAVHAAWADPTYWLYTAALVEDGVVTRDGLLDDLAAAGIDARPVWTPLHRLTLYRDAPRLGGAVADRVFDRSVSLPSSSSLSIGSQERVIDVLQRSAG